MELFIFLLFVFIVGYIGYLKIDVKYYKDQLGKAHDYIEDIKGQLKLIEKEVSLPKNKFNDSEYISLKEKYNQLEVESEKYKNRLSIEVDFHNRLKRNYKDLEFRFVEIENQLKPFLVINDLDKELNNRKDELNELKTEIERLEDKLELLKDYYSEHTIGSFHSSYKFEHVVIFKQALDLIELEQTRIRKDGQDFICNSEDLIKSPILKSIKFLALSFINSEVDRFIDRARPENFDSSRNKIKSLYEHISKLLTPLNCSIGSEYFNLSLKKMEISVAYEEEQERIKSEQQEIKRMLREEENARIEAEELLEKSVENEKKYNDLVNDALRKYDEANEFEKRKMLSEIEQLKQKVSEAHEATVRATSLAQITKAGHVYIVSNVGSFGENIFKIGLTRRENPYDRVKELGDASVPFSFDVHAMIKVDDAPKLEYELHKSFEERRVNKINNKKEFFHVSIDEIESVCADKGLDFKITKIADAYEYHSSLELRKQKKAS